MRRRALLAAAAAATAVGTAGCLSLTSESSTTAPTTTPTTSTASRRTTLRTAESDPTVVGDGDHVALDGFDFDLGEIGLQSSFVEHRWPLWDARASPTGLFAVVRLSAGGLTPEDPFDPSAHAVVDGHRIVDAEGPYRYLGSDGAARLAVPVPAGEDVDAVAVAFEDSDEVKRYPLDDTLLARIRDPPSLRATVEVPDAIGAGEPLSYGLTIRNDGASTGTLAVTTTTDAIADRWWTRRRTVAPGASETVTFEPYSGDGDVRIQLDWGLGSVERTVADEGATTAVLDGGVE